VVLDLSEHKGPDAAAGAQEGIGALARSQHGESGDCLLQLRVIPRRQQLARQPDAEDPRVLLEEALPHILPTSGGGVRSLLLEEVGFGKKPAEVFNDFLPMSHSDDVGGGRVVLK
jgi:hypothetical protein